MGLVVLLHIACYWLVTRFNASRDPSALVELTTPLDRRIPHLAWTWPFYWLTYPFVVLGAALALVSVPHGVYRRGVVAMVWVTLAGAVVQALVPSVAPWPIEPAGIQQWYHDSALVLPYANFPSMHVTYVVMTAGFLFVVFPRLSVRLLAIFIATGVVVSTATLKEHFVVDAAGGLLLSAMGIHWWRRGDSVNVPDP